MAETVKCMTGICPACERIVFTSVDEPDRREENAKEAASLIRAGIRIESWDVEAVRSGKWGCECFKPSKKESPQQGMFA